MDFADVTTITAIAASALSLVAVGRDVWLRLTQVRIGEVELSLTQDVAAADASPREVKDEVTETLAALSRLGTSRYALDGETRLRVEEELSRLERRLADLSER